MSELRQDPITGAWTLIAPERGRRPRGEQTAKGCPFCPGNEALLPGLLDETVAVDGRRWIVRAVPNRHPAVTMQAGTLTDACHYQAVAAQGRHEVIIDSPRHEVDLADLPTNEILALLGMMQRRHARMMALPEIQSVILFRNHGLEAGASLPHPHSQLIALSMVPPRLAAMAEWAKAGFERTGGCVACLEIARERADGRRILCESNRHLALVPYAASLPAEIRLLPRRHLSSFVEADEHDLVDLAELLRDMLARLATRLHRPAYNLVFDSAPRAASATPWFHWCLRILPQTGRPGGFELATGLPINSSLPEEAAAFLRGTK